MTVSKLVRGLTLTDSIAIVVGTIIGTGVFLKTATMAQTMGNPTWVLIAWVVGGALSLTGALAYAELGSIMPNAGGEYVYLKEGYGELWGFLYGWMRFWIGTPGSIAAYAVGAVTFASGMVNLDFLGGKVVASVFLITFFSILNCFSVAFGGKLNSFMTGLKLFMILGITVGIFLFAKDVSWSHFSESSPGVEGFIGWSAFGSAVLAALWAYDGWNNLSMVAGEIKDPKKNVPLSFGIGLLVILIIYGLTNVAYFYALPFSEILNSNSSAFPDALPVATKAALSFLGTSGVTILSAAFVFSALGAMNGSILTGARVPYAMAIDGLFFKKLGDVNSKSLVPVASVLAQACVAIMLALSGTFDQLTDYVVFSSWIFYAMVTGVVFKMRKTRPDIQRDYKTFGYPVLPAVFIIVGVLLLINTVYTSPTSSLIGLGFILSGIPVFFYFKKTR
ncbi:MAG: amino acid permease [Bdellovibrionales bacterium]|nr:amino acid permease [Bdellovibrionales bacterium]